MDVHGSSADGEASSVKQGRVTNEGKLAVSLAFNCGSSDYTGERLLRCYGDRPEQTVQEQDPQVEVARREGAIEQAKREMGWQVYATNHREMTLTAVVWGYRGQYRIEDDWSRLKGRSLSLTPMYLQDESRMQGRVLLLSLAIRLLTLLEWQVRERLARQRADAAGVYPGQPGRQSAATQRGDAVESVPGDQPECGGGGGGGEHPPHALDLGCPICSDFGPFFSCWFRALVQLPERAAFNTARFFFCGEGPRCSSSHSSTSCARTVSNAWRRRSAVKEVTNSGIVKTFAVISRQGAGAARSSVPCQITTPARRYSPGTSAWQVPWLLPSAQMTGPVLEIRFRLPPVGFLLPGGPWLGANSCGSVLLP